MSQEPSFQELDHNMALGNFANYGSSELGETSEDRNLYLWSCGLPAAQFNHAFPKAPIRDLGACVARAEAFFTRSGLPWRLILRRELVSEHAAALAGAGFEEAVRFPGMTLAPLPEAPPRPAGLEVREVADAAELEQFSSTAFAGFGLPESLGAKFITEAFAALPHVRLCLGLVEGEPVCTSAVVMTGDLIGIYWVATREAFRGRGLGAAITWAAVETGRAMGGTRACLQASELGLPVYERMGFAALTAYVQFERPKQA